MERFSQTVYHSVISAIIIRRRTDQQYLRVFAPKCLDFIQLPIFSHQRDWDSPAVCFNRAAKRACKDCFHQLCPPLYLRLIVMLHGNYYGAGIFHGRTGDVHNVLCLFKADLSSENEKLLSGDSCWFSLEEAVLPVQQSPGIDTSKIFLKNVKLFSFSVTI